MKEELLKELPNNFVEDLKLNEDQLKLIATQYKLLKVYNKIEDLSSYRVNLTSDGKLVLKEVH